MGLFKYEAVDSTGKKIFGQVEAASEKDVRKILRVQGVRTKKVIPPSILEFNLSVWLVDRGFASAIGAKEISSFTKQLALMISAGVPILQSLEILYRSEKNPTLKPDTIRKLLG